MKIKTIIKYFLLLYIIAISGFEFFFRIDLNAIYLLFPIAITLFFLFKEKFDYSSIIIILPFFIVYLFQAFFYDRSLIYAFTLFLRFFTIYLVTKIIGRDLIKIFIDLLKLISVVSLIFYVILYIPSIYNFILIISKQFVPSGLDESGFYRPTIIIYTIQPIEFGSFIFRNSGPFWEPGLYVVFLNVAMFLNTFIRKNIINKTNILFLTSAITTLSTTGIIVLFINIIFFSFTLKSLNVKYRILLIVIATISIPIVYSLPFMSGKINTQLAQKDVSYSRFGAIFVHWNIIKDYPFTGLPPDQKLYSKYSDNISPNGITEIFVRYGIIVGLIYFTLLLRSCKKIMEYIGYKQNGFLLFVVLVVSIFSQTIGNRPFYLLLLFVPIILDKHLQRNRVLGLYSRSLVFIKN